MIGDPATVLNGDGGCSGINNVKVIGVQGDR